MSARLALAAWGIAAALGLGGCKKSEPFEMMQAPAAPGPLTAYWKVPDFSLTERSGKDVSLADFAGRVWIADFFYSTCPGPCPMLTSRFSEVHQELEKEADVRLVSISVDPDKDTPEILQSYARKFGAGERWLFLTGKKDAIYRLAREGFKLPIAEPEIEGGLITHPTRLILVDKTGTVRGFYEGTGEEGVRDVLRDVRRLLEEK